MKKNQVMFLNMNMIIEAGFSSFFVFNRITSKVPVIYFIFVLFVKKKKQKQKTCLYIETVYNFPRLLTD